MYPVVPKKDGLRLDACIGLALALLGASTTAGWLLHVPALVQIVPGLVPMVFNTGLSFLCAGVALMLGARPSPLARHVKTVVIALVVALCVATIVELVIDRPLGIDVAALHAWFDYGNTRPGRMAPNTALGFVLFGAGLLAADQVRGRASAIAVLGLTFALLAVGLTGLVGYLLAPDLLFGWARSARMAVQTASGMILAALGLWRYWSRQTWYVGESYFRDDTKIRLLSAVIVVVVTLTAGLTGFVLLQYSFEQSLEQRLDAIVGSRIPQFRETVRQYRRHATADIALAGLGTSAPRWLASGDDASRLHLAQDAARLIAAGYRSVTIERPDGGIRVRFGDAPAPAGLVAPLDGLQGSELAWDGGSILRTRLAVGTDGDRLMVEQWVPEMWQSLVSTTGLGESAQIAVCIQGSTKLVCLPDSRNAAVYSVVPRGGASPLPMERALAGLPGTVYTVDYRGHNVVAALGRLAPGLGVVAKQDTFDAYAPIRRALSMGTPIILLVTLLGGGLMAWQLAPLVARLRRSEQLASDSAAKTAAIMHAAGDAIVTIDHLGQIQSANEAAHRIFGYGDGELTGQEVALLMPSTSREAQEQGLARILAAGAARLVGSSNVLVRGRRSDGHEFPVELTLRGVPLPGQPMFVGVMRDVTERHALEDKLSRMAQFDSLTGLPNRALFMDRLETAMARATRSRRTLGVMFLDLDGFKAINDSLGHRAGDEVLAQVAERLATGVRRTDTVARLGGDEFTVLLEDLSDPEVDPRAVAAKLLAALRAPMRASGRSVSVTASIGLALHPPEAGSLDASELLSRADGAMYAAKRAGKDACKAV